MIIDYTKVSQQHLAAIKGCNQEDPASIDKAVVACYFITEYHADIAFHKGQIAGLKRSSYFIGDKEGRNSIFDLIEKLEEGLEALKNKPVPNDSNNEGN